jgi:uncharacterized protein GlcG (DUF336 family)
MTNTCSVVIRAREFTAASGINSRRKGFNKAQNNNRIQGVLKHASCQSCATRLSVDACRRTKDGYKVSVVIVDKGGNVAASIRGDGTGPHTMEFARMKAYTARTRNQTSLQTMKLLEDPANAFIRQIPNVVGVGGGVPIRAGTETIGGVGVSGAPGGEKDEVCANAGLAKVEAALK